MTVGALQQKTIVITRPQHQSAGLQQMITAEGGMVVNFPVIDIQPLDLNSGVQADYSTKINHADLIIFISKNAMDCFSERFTSTDPGEQTVFLTMGESSADYLQQLGFAPAVYPDGIGSESLLDQEQLAADRIRGKNVVIIKGIGGRELLALTLRERGALVNSIDLYERRVPQTNAGQFTTIWKTKRPDALTFTSVEGIQNFLSMVEVDDLPGLYSIPVFVYGERVGNFSRESGFTTVYETRAASDDALVATLCEILESG